MTKAETHAEVVRKLVDIEGTEITLYRCLSIAVALGGWRDSDKDGLARFVFPDGSEVCYDKD